jgi:hypothetical protein
MAETGGEARSKEVAPPGPQQRARSSEKPDDILPPPPAGWGEDVLPPPPAEWGKAKSSESRDDDLLVVRSEPQPSGFDPSVFNRLDSELASIRRAWIVGVVAAAILAGVVIYALVTPPTARIVSVGPPTTNTSTAGKASSTIDSLQQRISDLKKELESRSASAGGRIKTLKRCFNQALDVQQHRMDLLLRRQLSAKHFLKLPTPVCKA